MNALRFAAAIVLFAGGGAIAQAAPKKTPPAATAASGWTLESDEVDSNANTGAFSVPKHVKMTREDGSIVQADRASGNYKKKRATLLGHVSVHDATGTFGLKSAEGTKRGPATLTADRVDIDNAARAYDAAGNVHYTQSDTNVDAEHAHLNDVTHRLDLSGKVHVVQGQRTLDAQKASYNTMTGAGEADGNTTLVFPGGQPSIATPKPIIIRGPKIH